jgi:hypothetical protein
VTDLQPAAMGAPREAARASSGRAGLRRVYASHAFTIWNAQPGSYTLRIHYLPYWQSASGACVVPAAGGMSRLVLRTAGRFTLHIDVSIVTLADKVLDNHAGHC